MDRCTRFRRSRRLGEEWEDKEIGMGGRVFEDVNAKASFIKN